LHETHSEPNAAFSKKKNNSCEKALFTQICIFKLIECYENNAVLQKKEKVGTQVAH